MKIRTILIASLLIAGAGYGAVALIRQATFLKNSCFKYRRYRFDKFNLRDAKLVVTCQIKNNSDIDLMIKNENLNVYINDMFVSNVKATRNTLLKGRTATDIDIAINFDPSKFIKTGVQSLFTAADNIKIRLKGTLTVVSSLIILGNIPVDETITLSEILKPSSQTSC